jgi:hypothetical protein
MSFILAVVVASLVWFVLAGALVFNPVVDKVYAADEGHPSVKRMPKTPAALLKLLASIVVQVTAWAWVYRVVEPALPYNVTARGVAFGLLLIVVKVLPGTLDRVLTTTYPSLRLAIEATVGSVGGLAVGLCFARLL